MSTETRRYGVGDASYQAAGGLVGLTSLVNDFYDIMDTLPEAKVIRDMHPKDLTESKRKLAYFLSGWLGGPRLYAKEYGPISIPMSHRHFPIGREERDAWLLCMEKAASQQPYEEAFRQYLIVQLRVPAERITVVCGR